MPKPGIMNFATPFLQNGIWLNGTLYRGASVYPANWPIDQQEGPIMMATMGKTDIVQSVRIGSSAPITLDPWDTEADFLLTREEDYWLFLEIATIGEPVLAHFDIPLNDAWDLRAAVGTNKNWYTSRPTPWGSTVTGITKANRPPVAFVGATSLTVVEVSPATGEIRINDNGGDHTTWQTGDDATAMLVDGNHLVVRYHPMMWVLLSDVRMRYRDVNGFRFEAKILEQRAGVFDV